MTDRSGTFSFEIIAADPDGHARLGRLSTPHGHIDTPAFMPVGTRGTVRGITPAQLRETGTQIVLANTYHLALRPQAEVVAALGGLHRFMGWNGPILTDSGGYQVFSLADLREIDDDGVTFRSHLDGAMLRLDPRRAIEIQSRLGADIIMAFDQCPRLPGSRDELEMAVERTIRWAALCKQAHNRDDQALFGIVQGGLDLDLRRRCLDALREIDFPGYAVGGLSVGESPDEMLRLLRPFAPLLPADRPRYLMGVGRPLDILRAVDCGIDLFDCVLPTRNGRNSTAFTDRGTLRLRNEAHRGSDRPLEHGCPCYTCRCFSRGYLRHLFLADEMLGPILVSIHNIAYYQRWMARIREALRSGGFDSFRARMEAVATPHNEDDA
jgi:queuine tRNA-ribosyltransferase